MQCDLGTGAHWLQAMSLPSKQQYHKHLFRKEWSGTQLCPEMARGLTYLRLWDPRRKNLSGVSRDCPLNR